MSGPPSGIGSSMLGPLGRRQPSPTCSLPCGLAATLRTPSSSAAGPASRIGDSGPPGAAPPHAPPDGPLPRSARFPLRPQATARPAPSSPLLGLRRPPQSRASRPAQRHSRCPGAPDARGSAPPGGEGQQLPVQASGPLLQFPTRDRSGGTRGPCGADVTPRQYR